MEVYQDILGLVVGAHQASHGSPPHLASEKPFFSSCNFDLSASPGCWGGNWSRSWALLWKREGVYNWVGCCLRWVGLGPDLESSRPWRPPAPVPPDKPQNCELADAITFRKDALPSWQERFLWLIDLFIISFSYWWFLRPDFTISTTFLFSHNFISLPGTFSYLISYFWPTMRGKRCTREWKTRKKR